MVSTAKAKGATENKHHSQTHVRDPRPGKPLSAAGLLLPEAPNVSVLQAPCSCSCLLSPHAHALVSW